MARLEDTQKRCDWRARWPLRCFDWSMSTPWLNCLKEQSTRSKLCWSRRECQGTMSGKLHQWRDRRYTKILLIEWCKTNDQAERDLCWQRFARTLAPTTAWWLFLIECNPNMESQEQHWTKKMKQLMTKMMKKMYSMMVQKMMMKKIRPLHSFQASRSEPRRSKHDKSSCWIGSWNQSINRLVELIDGLLLVDPKSIRKTYE